MQRSNFFRYIGWEIEREQGPNFGCCNCLWWKPWIWDSDLRRNFLKKQMHKCNSVSGVEYPLNGWHVQMYNQMDQLPPQYRLQKKQAKMSIIYFYRPCYIKNYWVHFIGARIELTHTRSIKYAMVVLSRTLGRKEWSLEKVKLIVMDTNNEIVRTQY